MARFHYQATDADGNPTAGDMEATDAKELIARLEADGLRVQSIHAAFSERDSVARGPGPPRQEGAGPREPLSVDDVDQLARQLEHLTQADLPLAGGLKAFADELPRGRLRRLLHRMVGQLERGENLERVLASGAVPDDLLALLRAGVRTGNPSLALSQYVSQARQLVEIRRRVTLAMGYPLILLTASAAIFVLFLALIVPTFREIFGDFGVELPAVTGLLLAASRLVTEYSWWLLIIAVGAVLFIAVGQRWGIGRGVGQSVAGRLPFVGQIRRYAAMARFSHLLAVLIEQEVPLPESIALAGSGSADPQLREAAEALGQRVAAGDALAASASELSCIPRSFVQAIRWEKHTDAIPQLLRALAEMYEAQTRDRATMLAAVCEPVIIALTAGMLGFMVLGLLAPMVSLISNLSS
jgi:type II secretory pathway component PulF